MIILTCGGTGGHITPALNIANKLKTDTLFIGGNRLEKNLLQNNKFISIPVSRKNPLIILKGIFKSFRIIKKHKPTAIIATGGYVTLPVGIAAKLTKTPLFLQEQNSIPGKTNKFLARFATNIFTGYPDKNQVFPVTKTVYTGNPLPDIKLQQKTSKSTKNLIILGGSQGAKKINDTFLKAIPKIKKLPLNVTWITGEKQFDKINNSLKNLFKRHPKQNCHSREDRNQKFEDSLDYSFREENIRITIYAFFKPVTDLLQSIDFSISRAGAMSVAELTGYKIPTIYIPYPYATDNHQHHNAEHITSQGLGLLLPENQLSPTILIQSINEIVDNWQKYKAAFEGFNQPNSVELILKELRNRKVV